MDPVMTVQTPYQPLLDLATPDLYRRNPFRVLGLPPRATTRDAQRASQRMKMRARLGQGPTTAAGEPATGIQETPTEAQIDAAMERLTHPTARLLDELLWFWPAAMGADQDPAIQAWLTGDADGARTHWQMKSQRADTAQSAFHNLAILDHLSALDMEERLARGAGVKSIRWEDVRAHWKRALSQWHQVLKDESLWGRVKERIRELDDAQLTTGLVRRLSETFPLALSLINARLAYAAAERHETSAARRQLDLLRESPFGQEVAQDALAEVLKPLRARVNTLVDQAKTRWTTTPQHGNRYVRDLHTQVMPLLAIADILLPEKDFARTSLHDLVAQAINDGEAAFSNKTNDWREGNALLSLAQSIAIGEPIRDKIAQSQKINQDNIESGNDWCSPGYWDLPEATIEALEAARQKAMSGDLDGALDALIVMDASVGKPLKRCMAYTLSTKGIRIHNAAMDDLNAEYSSIGRIMDRLRGMSEYEFSHALSNRPDPYSPSYLNPPCLCCGNRHYSSWVNFTYRNIPLFMCSNCNDEHEREKGKRRQALRSAREDALKRLLLATELDPGDAGLKRNLKTLRENAAEDNSTIPTPDSLKKALADKTNRIVGASGGLEAAEPGALCHFCEQEAPDQSSAITVRMSGDLHKITCMFGSRVQYSYIHVVVPRCTRCRDEHRRLIKHRADWQDARTEATADDQFPELVSELTAAQGAAEAAEQACKSAHQAIAQSKLRPMQRTLLAAYPVGLLATVFALLQQIPEPLFWGAVQLETLSGWNADEATLYLPIAIAALIGPLLGWRLGARLHRGWSKHREEARIALTAAEAERARAADTIRTAEARLQTAKSEADAAYLAAHPQPELPSGIKPESTYGESTPVKTRERQGWSIGMLEGTAKAYQVVRKASDIKGLVDEPA